MVATSKAADFRAQRLVWGLVTSFISKGAAFVTQLLAIPVAIKFCGVSVYADYLTVLAASLAPSVFLLRFGPDFVSKVSTFHFSADDGELASYLQRSFKLTLVNCLIAGFVAIVVISTVPLDYLLGREQSAGLLVPLVVLSGMQVVSGCFATVEAFQAGVHETHILYIRSTFSNVIAALLLFLLIPFAHSLLVLLLVLQGVPFITRFANFAVFLVRNSKLWNSASHANVSYRTLLTDSLGYTFAMGFCGYLAFQFPLLLFLSETGPVDGEIYAISLQIVLQLQGLIVVLLAPVVPAIGGAIAEGDATSIFRIWRRITCGILFLGASLACGIVVLEQWFATFELVSRLNFLIEFGIVLLFVTTALETCFQTFLLAIVRRKLRFRVFGILGMKSVIIAIGLLVQQSFNVLEWSLVYLAATTFFISAIPFLCANWCHLRNGLCSQFHSSQNEINGRGEQ